MAKPAHQNLELLLAVDIYKNYVVSDVNHKLKWNGKAEQLSIKKSSKYFEVYLLLEYFKYKI